MIDHKWFAAILAMAPDGEVWKRLGVILLGILLGADLAVLGYVAKKLEDLDTRITAIAIIQASSIGERKGQIEAIRDRLTRLEAIK